jgi:mannosyl-3-phosphoglycerate phosphatase
LRPPTPVVFCAIDSLISPASKPLPGFHGFLEALSQAGIPCIWISSRNRVQLDAAFRKFGHSDPFIAEGGAGAYIPEDYFHLKPAHTVRLGRFTCIPIASLQPAAEIGLGLLAELTGVSVVPLRTLSPHELAQNTGLPERDAELLRQRDFDELFFFVGASESRIKSFREEAARRRFSLRPRGTLWSLSVGAGLAGCVRELSKLFDRARHARSFRVAVATPEEASELFPTCDLAILLADGYTAPESFPSARHKAPFSISLFSPNAWETALEVVRTKRH